MNCIVRGSAGHIRLGVERRLHVSPPWRRLKGEILIFLPPVAPSAGSSRPAGSPQPPAPRMNHAAVCSCTRQSSMRGLKSPLFPLSFGNDHRKSRQIFVFWFSLALAYPPPTTAIHDQQNASSWTLPKPGTHTPVTHQSQDVVYTR